MTKEKLLHYDFETDEVFPEYTLILHFRNIKNEYLVKAFKNSLKKLDHNKADAADFIDKQERLTIPAKFFNNIDTAVGKDFKNCQSMLARKHDIMFTSWKIENAFFYRNVQDSNEWILTVIYKGSYEDD